MSGIFTTIEISGVGPVLIENSKRARRLSITVRPFKGVRVAVPFGISLDRAEDFVRAKKEWVAKHVASMKKKEKHYIPLLHERNTIESRVSAETIRKRLAELAVQYGFTYNKVTIRNQKTRWGSCSARNNISLNVKLAQLPQDLMDYVLLHELVHTRIKSHSRSFWAALEEIIPDVRQLRIRLRGYFLRCT